MRIAINARFLLPAGLEGLGRFTYEVVRRLVRDHPEHEFLLFFDRAYDPGFIFADNVRPVVLSPPARHPVLWLWWFEVAIPRAFARCRPDVFLSPDNFMSLRADVPTVLVIHDVAFERFAQGISFLQRRYYRFMAPRWCRRAATVVTVSEFSRAELCRMYGLDPAAVRVAHNGVSEAFEAVTESERSSVMRRYGAADGYFLHLGAIHPRKNVVGLLRAFDLYKTRTGRATKLLLAGRLAWKYEDVVRTHHEMEHRDDVTFLGFVDEPELARIVASSLAVVCPSFYEGFGLPLVEAMVSGVPVIAAAAGALPEIAGDAAVWVDPRDPESLTAAMERIASDDTLRAQLIERGLRRAGCFSWDETARRVWAALEQAATPP